MRGSGGRKTNETKKPHTWTSQVVHWLRLCVNTSKAGSVGLIPVCGTKIPHTAWYGTTNGARKPEYLCKNKQKNKIATTPHTHTHTSLDTTPQVLGKPLLICVLHYLRSVHQKLDQTGLSNIVNRPCVSNVSCFSHVQLLRPMDRSPPGSSVHRIL